MAKRDRISNLPVCLIYHIFSFLHVYNVVQTCVLSKYWRNIWHSSHSFRIDNLEFREHPIMKSISFEKFVDFLLLTRGGSSIHKFSAFIAPDHEPPSEAKAIYDHDTDKVHSWIIHPLRHNVQVIDISSYICVPPLIFSCESLRELSLCVMANEFEFPPWVNLPSLKVLHMYEALFHACDDTLFSSMPCLETLKLEDCEFNQNRLLISTPKLRILMMTVTFRVPIEISIVAPNLKCFKLGPSCCYSAINSLRFKDNCTQLVNVDIEVPLSCSQSMIGLFTVLRNTSSLKLSAAFLKSFTRKLRKGMCVEDCIKTPFPNLTHMELTTAFSDDEALVINKILYHSPCIEVLRIAMDGRRRTVVTVGGSSAADDVWSKFKLSRLKLVEINDFQATENQISFVKFLLENALVLEDLIIAAATAYKSNNRQEMRKIGQELRMYPKASPTVVMQFG
ncbi:hypothetical protein ACHQM5_013242 [Ranunculus cassubicifolius]